MLNQRKMEIKRQNQGFNIPMEVIEIILLYLPVKSLVRFKCVSTNWYNLINSQHFIELHLNQNRNTLNIFYSATHDNRYTVTLTTGDDDAKLWIEPILVIERLPIKLKGSLHIVPVGSCNGIICLRACNRCSGFTLLNPSTRTHFKLPTDRYRNPNQDKHYVNEIMSYGFGYDRAKDDYKVVRIDVCNQTRMGYVSVCSWRNRRWIIDCDKISNVYKIVTRNATFSMNDLHWIVWDSVSQDHVVASFDLGLNKFHSERLSLPLCTGADLGHLGYVFNLFDLDDCLHLVAIKKLSTSFQVDIWMLKDHNKKSISIDSWCKLTRVGIATSIANPPFPQVITYSKRSSEILFYTRSHNHRNEYSLINPVTGKVKVLLLENDHIFASNVVLLEQVPYMESLVSLDHDDKELKRHRGERQLVLEIKEMEQEMKMVLAREKNLMAEIDSLNDQIRQKDSEANIWEANKKQEAKKREAKFLTFMLP